MKLKRLRITGLRGAAENGFELEFGEGSVFLYGENGMGKTTIVDAIELLMRGDIPGYHRQGCPLSAAIHIDADSARVEAGLADPERDLRRILPDNEAGPLLEIAGDGSEQEIELPDVPLLRHSTIRDFMEKSAGDKRKALLELLRLDSLSDFRDTLKSAANDAKDTRRAAQATREEYKQALDGLLEGSSLLGKAEELREASGKEDPIASEEDLAGLSLHSIPGEPNRHKPLAELATAVEGCGDDPAQEWNALIADESLRSSDALAALIDKGREVLSSWEEDACPLCEAEQDREQLGASLDSRAKALAEVREQISASKQKLTSRAQAVAKLAKALRSALEVAPAEGWPEQAELEAAASALEECEMALCASRDQLAQAPSAPDLAVDLKALLPVLREAADAAQASPRVAAHNSLLALKDQHRRLTEKDARLKQAEAEEEIAKKVLSTAEETIKAAIKAALDGLAERIAAYFEVLVADPVYSEISLRYEQKYAGQVEFSVRFDGRAPMTPPQKIMSESQLNALGIALFLARAKSDAGEQWRTLVLDDVVSSFDFSNRAGLMRLLKEEFGDWQVFVLSHDASFRDIASYIVGQGAGWSFFEIVAWDPKGGIVLGQGNALNRLEKELDEGKGASSLAGLARRALEQALAQVMGKLGYRVEYRPRGNHTAFELLESLRRELKDSGSDLGGLRILDEIKGSNYFATLGVHYRPGDPDPTKADLRQLVEDVRKLQEGFTCQSCEKPVWFRRPTERKCECGELAA